MIEALKDIGRFLVLAALVIGGVILVYALMIGLIVLAGGSSAGY